MTLPRRRRRPPPLYPPPSAPLPPLPGSDSSTPPSSSPLLTPLITTMYPAPGGLSPWRSHSPPSSLHNNSDACNSHLVLRGPLSAPLWRPGTAAPHLNRKRRVQSHPISPSPSHPSPHTSHIHHPSHPHHTTSPSEAGLVLNVHGGLDTSSRLHHRFRCREVPYPRSYERSILDLDNLDTLLTRQMSGGSLTWHIFPPSWNALPPQGSLKKVLDLGCGNGAWVIEAAKCWKGCEVVGLDIVSVHPDLPHVSKDKDLTRRVSWVQANFLEGIPFANDEFDFVHVKRIARGVPEDKWDNLFEEISRVMKPGAAFEVVEEDLTFPGWSENDDMDSISASHRNSYLVSIRNHISPSATESERFSAVESMSSASDSANSASPNLDIRPSTHINKKKSLTSFKHPSTNKSTRSLQSPKQPSTPSSSPSSDMSLPPARKSNKAAQAVLMEPAVPFFATSVSSSFMSTTTNRPSRTPKKNKAAQAVLMEPTMPFFVPYNKSRTSLPGGEGHKVRASLAGSFGRSRVNLGWGKKGSETGSGSSGSPRSSEVQEPRPSSVTHVGGGALPCMTGNRNLESVLDEGDLEANGPEPPGANVGGSHANGGAPPQVDGSAPPPQVDSTGIPPQNPRDHSILETIYNEMHAERFINLSPLSLLANTVGLWFKDVRTHPPIVFHFPPLRERPHVCLSSSNPPSTTRRNSGDTIISLYDLYRGASPYASLDSSLDSAISIQTQSQIRTRLPNPALDVDLRSLNLHLALRVKEIVACAEAMWEWVCEFQTGEGKKKEKEVYSKILELTRSQFDELLLEFELDMREHIGLGSALEDRFNWRMIPGPTPQEKRFFDMACDKWEAHRHLQDSACSVVPHPATRLSRSLRVFVAWKPASRYAQL